MMQVMIMIGKHQALVMITTLLNFATHLRPWFDKENLCHFI